MSASAPPETAGRLPYWRLSGFYFFFFAALGAMMPYWGPYLREQGFSAAEIGELLAILHATKIIAPNVWGALSDRLDRRMAVVRAAATVAMVAFSGVLLVEQYGGYALVMALFGFFWNAAIPQYEANTFNHLQGREELYARVRLWGSIGFIVAVVGIGEMMDRVGVGILPSAVLLIFVGLCGSSFLAPEARRPEAPAGSGAFWQILRQPPVLGFFGACFLNQMAHGPFYGFFSIHLQDHGYSGSLIGALWAWGVIAEVAVFLVMHRILPYFGARTLLVTAMVLAAVRWVLIGLFVDWPWIIAASQTLHAASFGVYHAVAIDTVNRFFQGRSQGRGQALYSSFTFGAGVAAGSLASGWAWAQLEGQTFLFAALIAALAALLAFRSLPPNGRENPAGTVRPGGTY